MQNTEQLQKPVLNYAVEYFLSCIAQSGGEKKKEHSHVTHLVSCSTAMCVIVTYLVPG